MKANKFFRILFFILTFSNHIYSQINNKLGIEHLKFEKQWILKNLADEYFLGASLNANTNGPKEQGDLEKAFVLYENAQNMVFNKERFINSNYYGFTSINDEALLNLVQLDINFRKSLLLANKSFYSNAIDQNQTSPRNAKNDFMQSFDRFSITANQFIAVNNATDSSELDQLEASMETWNEVSTISDYENEISVLNNRISTQEFNLEKWTNESTGHFGNVQSVSNELNQIVNEITSLEKQLDASITKAAYSSIGLPDLSDGFQLEDGLEFISGIEESPVLKGLVPNSRDGFYELADYFKTSREFYQKAAKVVKIGERIDDILEKDGFGINDVIDIGNELANGIEVSSGLNPDLTELSSDIREQLEIMKRVKRFGEVIELDDEVKSCLKEGKITCLDDAINGKLQSLCDGVDSEFCEYQRKWNTIKEDLRNKFDEEIKLFESANGILEKDLDIKSGTDLIKLLASYGDYTFSEDEEEAFDIIATLDTISKIEVTSDFKYFEKIGDHIFNMAEFEQYKEKWKEYARKSKSLILLYTKLKKQLEADDRVISILFDELSVQKKVEVEQISRKLISSLVSVNSRALNILFEDMLENSPEIMVQRLYKDNQIRRQLRNRAKIQNKNDLEQYFGGVWRDEQRRKVRFSKLDNQRIRIRIYRVRNDGSLGSPFPKDLNFSARALVKIYLETSLDDDYIATKFIIKNLSEVSRIDREGIEKYFQTFLQHAENVIRNSSLESNSTVYDLLYNQLTNNEKAQINEHITKISIGSNAYLNNDNNFFSGVNITEDFKRNVNRIEISPDGNTKSNSDFYEQATYAALNYYMPGAGYALSALKTMGEIDGAIDEYNTYLNVLRNHEKNLLETVQKRDMARSNLTVFENQKNVFESRIKMANYGMRTTNLRDMQIDETLEQKRNLLASILPRLFFESEVLRRDYAKLNESLKYWTGKSFAEAVLSDENLIRLAIDPDIRIYQWLDLNGVGKRTQVFDLISQWSQLHSLVASMQEGDISIGNRFGITRVLEVQDFNEVLSGFDREQQEITYELPTDSLQFDHNNKTQLLRLVLNASAIVYDSEGRVLPQGVGSAIRLVSSGEIENPKTLKELEYNMHYSKPEGYRDFSLLGLNCANPSNGLAECLAGAQFSNQIKEIEGNPFYSAVTNFYSYPLDSRWSLKIRRGIIDLSNIDKIQIAFHYQYQENEPPKEFDPVKILYSSLNNSAVNQNFDKPVYYQNGRTVVWHERNYINQDIPKSSYSFNKNKEYTNSNSEIYLYETSN